ncbi:MAG: thymidine phosphorylase [Pseudobdellovibrionaceae bacterium]|nr:thymidine phosphorylase [Bdellovibrionales bacterium]USN46893.1 MAG: thymidine phosphorylase [Pseudobdellovibrionaceae bacterium]
MSFIPAQIIKKKRLGQSLSNDELSFMIDGFTSGSIPDYQMSALTMAICFQGMDLSETAWLTRIMRDSGKTMDFSQLGMPTVDKHSTGGVGDKTSLIIAGIIEAAEGLAMPMVAGRGLGHTGGTLDKLVSIPGFSVDMSLEQFQKNINKFRVAIMGQTKELCPADRKLYALRDVTATVESLPLICASIMSKKLAEDLNGLVLDVKFGSGAFMKTKNEARSLAELLKMTGEKNGLRVTAVLSDMSQPLGRFVGNSLEVQECLDILSNKQCVHDGVDYYETTRELSLRLSGHLLYLGGRSDSPVEGYNLSTELLESGLAVKAFEALCQRQGATLPIQLPQAKHQWPVQAPRQGYIKAMDCESIGYISVQLGAGRLKSSDEIDPAVGIEVNSRIGQRVEKGTPLFFVHSNQNDDINGAMKKLQDCIIWSDKPEPAPPIVSDILQ